MDFRNDVRRHARTALGWAAAMTLAVVLEGPPTFAAESHDRSFCSATASALFTACRAGTTDDFYTAKAKCINVEEAAERRECLDEAKQARQEGQQLCEEQREGRLDACRSLGEDRYDPDLDPSLFDDPRHPTHPNPYFPMAVDNRWEYRGGDETNVVEVVDETKRIEDLTCQVFRDRVFRKGDLAEDTDDWFVPAKDGSVWYCGEEVKDYQSFEGDVPRRPELVAIDGSFKMGRDLDKPGIIFPAAPKKGQFHREEFSLGNAEDVTEILSVRYAFGADPQLDTLVPRALAERLCSGDCVVTRNFSLLEPGVSARKYYARGIGFFLEVSPDTAEVLQLVDCNFDSRCVGLPVP